MSSSPLLRSIRRKPATKTKIFARHLFFERLETRRLLNSDGTVISLQKIADGVGGGPTLADTDRFGTSVSSLGDLDGDGVTDLAVGAQQGQTGYRGAVHVLFLNSNGTVKNSQTIANGVGGGPTLATFDRFGSSLSLLDDVDGDGVRDLAVGAQGDNTGGFNRGAVHLLLMNSNGTVKSSQKIAHGVGGGPTLGDADTFGSSMSVLSDLDGDGVRELAVGALGYDGYRGAVHILFMNSNGTVKSSQKITSGVGGGPTFNYDYFASSISSLGDLDGDGVTELAVGARRDDTAGLDRGAVYVLLLNSNGTAKSFQKIAHGVGGGPPLANGDLFGTSGSGLGDLDGDGVPDLAVGARWDDSGGNNRGAVHVLFMNTDGTVRSSQKIGDGVGGGPALVNSDYFGESVSLLNDVNGDGANDLAVGARGVDTGGNERGAAYVLFLTPTAATAAVTATVINGGQVNRSGLASLALQFNESVTVSGPEALQLWNHTTGAAVSISGATLAGNGSNAITWDLTSVTVPDGFYTAKLPQAEGLAATFSTLFHVLPGDSSGDAQVGFTDFGDLAGAFNTVGGPAYGPGDMNGDGSVNFGDFGILASNFNRTLAVPAIDFGDAPEAGTSFPTTLANDGARHIQSGIILGATIDGEADGQPSATASGDGADEDGVTFGGLQAGASAALTVSATFPSTAVLNAWIDFNRDGDWDDTGEQVFVDQSLSNGTNNLTVPVPVTAVAGPSFARFRLASCAGHSYSGLAVDGEVEDYSVTIVAASRPSARLQLWTRMTVDQRELPTDAVWPRHNGDELVWMNVLIGSETGSQRVDSDVILPGSEPLQPPEPASLLDDRLVDQSFADSELLSASDGDALLEHELDADQQG